MTPKKTTKAPAKTPTPIPKKGALDKVKSKNKGGIILPAKNLKAMSC